RVINHKLTGIGTSLGYHSGRLEPKQLGPSPAKPLVPSEDQLVWMPSRRAIASLHRVNSHRISSGMSSNLYRFSQISLHFLGVVLQRDLEVKALDLPLQLFQGLIAKIPS